MRHIIFLNGIWPSGTNYTRSIGPYQLKHWISHFGFKGQVIDYCQLMSPREIINATSQFIDKDTLAIGVSSTFWDGLPVPKIPTNLRIALLHLKSRYPHVKFIAGGARTPVVNDFDYVFSGDAEDSLVVWLQEQAGKKGMSLFNKKFDITTLAHRFDDHDAIMQDEVLPIELGRGCIFKCKFCAHKNLGKPKHTYQRDFKLFTDELQWNKDKWNVSNYLFLDDTVNEDVDKLTNFSHIKDILGFSINWVGYLRADLVWAKPESAELLLESGLKSCFFGIETFHPAAGRSIDKGWAAKHGKDYIPKLYNEIWDKKVNIHCNFIVGLPFEDRNSINSTVEWCRSNNVGHHRFVPLTLYLEKHDNSVQSEFTKNYAKYGYFNVDESTGYWENDHMNSYEAAELCNNINPVLMETNKTSCWNAFSALNLGINYNDIHCLPAKEIHDSIVQKQGDFKKRYLSTLQSLKD